MKNKDKFDGLLEAWEETYKKGQLTLWIFLALRDDPKYVGDILEFIDTNSASAMRCEEQSLYRNLRKFHYLGVVDFENVAGSRGPERKRYFLTPLGNQLFEIFVRRNMLVFFKPSIHQLIKNV